MASHVVLLGMLAIGACEGEGAGDDAPPGSFESTDDDGDGYASDDCDENDPEIHPGASERCDDDDADEDCDGAADDADTDAQGKIQIYVDDDGDGYGDAEDGLACDAASGFSAQGGDCDDGDAAIHPDGVEVCDDLDKDEDCDGAADDADSDTVGQVSIYEDADGDGYGSGTAHAEVCEPPSGFSTESGDCEDDNPEIHPDAAEVCEDGFDNNCDGSPNGCALTGTIELSSSTAHAKITGVAEHDYLSVAMCPLGDMDGDGNDDFVLGAPGPTALGQAYVFHGPVSGALDANTAGTTVEATFPSLYGYLGYSCAGPADLDDDGAADLVLGAPYWTDPKSGVKADGAVAIWFGSLGATESTADVVLYGTVSSVAGDALAVGDVDGDGTDDLVVSASGAGVVWYFEGPLSGGTTSVTSATATLDYAATGSKFLGLSDTDVGDYDADGLDDIVVGSGFYSGAKTGSYAGTLFVVNGSPSGAVSLEVDADVSMSGSTDAEFFGQSVAMGGDANGDGYDDLLVGVPGLDGWGAAFLLHGPLTGDATVITRLPESSIFFGWTVAYVGDLSSDGRDDIAIGQSSDDIGATLAGSVRLFYGPLAEGASYTSDDADALLIGESELDGAGSSVAGAGDQNGDGYADLLVGTSDDDDGGEDAGAAYLFLGGGGI